MNQLFEGPMIGEEGKKMDDETFQKETALHVCHLLDGFQKEYEANTSGCKMPGNDLYSEKLMVIVEEARAALAIPSPGSAAPAAGLDTLQKAAIAYVQAERAFHASGHKSIADCVGRQEDLDAAWDALIDAVDSALATPPPAAAPAAPVPISVHVTCDPKASPELQRALGAAISGAIDVARQKHTGAAPMDLGAIEDILYDLIADLHQMEKDGIDEDAAEARITEAAKKLAAHPGSAATGQPQAQERPIARLDTLKLRNAVNRAIAAAIAYGAAGDPEESRKAEAYMEMQHAACLSLIAQAPESAPKQGGEA